MAHVRKVIHPSGKPSWRATIQCLEGKRRSKNFPRKGEAEAWLRENDGAAASGSAIMTMKDLAISHNQWFQGLVRSGERSQRTLDGYASHLAIHLLKDPLVAAAKLSEVEAPMLQGFLDRLIYRTGSVELARRLKVTLSAWIAHGARNGWIKGDPIKSCKVVQRKRKSAGARVAIPPKAELTRLLMAADDGPNAMRDAAIIHILMYAGLRISELLGLADDAVDLARQGGMISVRERLCSIHVTLGDVKSEDGLREVPIGVSTATAIKAWRLARGPVSSGIVKGAYVPGRLFPGLTGKGGYFWSYQDFRRQCWFPMMIRAGLGVTAPDAKGVQRARSDFGVHTLRHTYASIQIESGVTPKKLQKLLGHATLGMTMDLYGHLWRDPAGDQALADAAELVIPRRA